MTPKLITEFIGTFFLVLIVSLCAPTAGNFAPVAIGLGLMVLVYMGGHVSGAHYNPAVTLAVVLRGKASWGEGIAYWVVQIIAGVAAAVLGAMLLRKAGLDPVVFMPTPADTAAWKIVVTAELVATFLLALTVLNVATAKETSGNSYFGVAIGCAVLACAYAFGGISGGAFNPAVGLGPAVAKLIYGGTSACPGHAWMYVVGPMLGAALAAYAFKAQHSWRKD